MKARRSVLSMAVVALALCLVHGASTGARVVDDISTMAAGTKGEKLTKDAMLLVAEGKEDEALAKFEKAAELESHDPGRWANLGSAFSALGRKDEAATAFKRGLKIAPNDALIKKNLKALGPEYAISAADAVADKIAAAAEASEPPKKFRKAKKAAKESSDDDPVDIDSMAAGTKGEKLTKAAIKLVAEGKEDEALAKFEKAAEYESYIPGRWANLGSAYNALGRKDEAAAAFKRGLRIAPKDSLLKNNLKELGPEFAISAAEETAAAATALADNAGEFDSNEAPTKRKKVRKSAAAASVADSGKDDDDVNELDDMAEGTRGEKLTKEAMKLVAEGNEKKALRKFVEAAALEPRIAGRWANLGSVYSALGNKSEAAAAFKRGLRIAPKDSLLKMNLKALGKEYAITEEEAEEAAAAAARDTGNFGVDSVLATAQASSDEGIIYAQEGKPKRALKAFQKAVKLDPDKAGNWANLGSAYAALDRKDDAAAAFKRGLKLDPASVLLMENLAVLGDGYVLSDEDQQALASAFDEKAAAEDAARKARAARRKMFLSGSVLDKKASPAASSSSSASVSSSSAAAASSTQAKATAGKSAAVTKTTTKMGAEGAESAPSSHADLPEKPQGKRFIKEGIAFAQAGKPKLALKAFKKATEVDPENAGYWANLGRAQADAGLASEAAVSFRRGIAEAHDQPELFDLLTSNLARLGDSGPGGGGGAASDGESSGDRGKAAAEVAVEADGTVSSDAVAAAATAATVAFGGTKVGGTPPVPLPMTPARAPKGGKVSLVSCSSTKGPLTIAVYDAWAPIGAARFLELVQDGFFSSKIGLFRAVENFMVQFGLSGDPAVSEFWARRAIPDDTQWMPKGPRRFRRGFISFAGGGEASRTTQLFIAYNNLGLGDAPHEVPFGQLVGEESLATLDAWYKGYGEMEAFGGKAPDQGRIAAEGLAYLELGFPRLDYITGCDLTWQSDELPPR